MANTIFCIIVDCTVFAGYRSAHIINTAILAV